MRFDSGNGFTLNVDDFERLLDRAEVGKEIRYLAFDGAEDLEVEWWRFVRAFDCVKYFYNRFVISW